MTVVASLSRLGRVENTLPTAEGNNDEEDDDEEEGCFSQTESERNESRHRSRIFPSQSEQVVN